MKVNKTKQYYAIVRIAELYGGGYKINPIVVDPDYDEQYYGSIKEAKEDLEICNGWPIYLGNNEASIEYAIVRRNKKTIKGSEIRWEWNR